MKEERKRGSRSLVMERGRPKSLNQLSWNRRANPSEEIVMFVGTNITRLRYRSTIVKIASYPLDSGRGPIKSMVTFLKGVGMTGRECRGDLVLYQCGLYAWQARQPLT